MFESLDALPPDPILGLSLAFKEDSRANKIDLGVGIYKDESGGTPVMRAIKEAEKAFLGQEQTKAYIPQVGVDAFNDGVMDLVLGADHPAMADNRVSTVMTPGGTGALRLGAELIRKSTPGARVWVGDPTWANHLPILLGAGLETETFPYYHKESATVLFDDMLQALDGANAGDAVLIHGCCHNPCGADLDRAQWQKLADLVVAKGLLPFIDLAYQGFGEGLDEDAYGVRLLAESLDEVIITSSCSKNFGIYCERTGCLIMVAKNAEQMENVRSQIAIVARENYSNPPAHGGSIVSEILHSAELAALWREELTEMRDRINTLRSDFVESLKPYDLDQKYACVAEQRGMFSYTGLQPEQVDRLRDEFGIYMVRSGRANVAGFSRENLPYLAKAIAAVN